MRALKFCCITLAAALAGGLLARGGAYGEEADQRARASHSASAPVEADEHAAGAGGTQGGSAGGGGPLTWETDLAIWTLVVFVALFLVLRKFAWGPIAAGLDRRERRIAEQIAAAQRSHDEARAMLAEYERKLAKAQDEVRGIIDEARRDAQHTAQEIVEKARADAQTEVARGRREIETATAQALKELAETSANMAVDLAGKIIRTNLGAADHNRLIEEAMASFPKGDPRRN
ncbi:MAG: F0F1 ATP synthase subunit B [Pirellulales bacterium]